MGLTFRVTESIQVSAFSRGFEKKTPIEADVGIPFELSIGPAKTGTLTTRTDANTGTITGQASHGVTTGARLDVYWSGGSRRGMTVGTVSVNSIPVDGGSGDDLPAATTSLTIMVPVEQALVVEGDDITAYVVDSSVATGTVVFADASDVELASEVLSGARVAEAWYAASGLTNPLAGDSVAKIFVSHGDTSVTNDAPAKIRGVLLYN